MYILHPMKYLHHGYVLQMNEKEKEGIIFAQTFMHTETIIE